MDCALLYVAVAVAPTRGSYVLRLSRLPSKVTVTFVGVIGFSLLVAVFQICGSAQRTRSKLPSDFWISCC